MATTAFAREAAYAADIGHLTARDIARATGVAVSTAGAWLRHTRTPSGERAERLAEPRIPPGHWLPRAMWRIAVRLGGVADLTSTAGLGRVGLAEPRPARRDWPPFQAVGEQLFAEGFPGLLYQAAARPQGVALCV